MEVPISPDLEAKVSRVAAQQGRAVEAVIIEAVENMVNYDEWFLNEVENGIAAAEQGKLIDHAEVRKLIDKRYPG
jgi:predicted transcriptional regulator